MTKPTENIACPVCSSELTLAQLLIHEEARDTIARLIAVSIPLGARVMQYVTLFAPPKTRLTTSKQVRIVLQLLPDLERQAITHKGRDWTVPLATWARAFDHMQTLRSIGRLDLPMSGHNYLYSTLTGMTDRHEAQAEQQVEAERRAPRSDSVQVRGQAVSIGQALVSAQGSRDPHLAKLDADRRNAAPMPDAVRALSQSLKAAKPHTKEEPDA